MLVYLFIAIKCSLNNSLMQKFLAKYCRNYYRNRMSCCNHSCVHASWCTSNYGRKLRP